MSINISIENNNKKSISIIIDNNTKNIIKYLYLIKDSIKENSKLIINIYDIYDSKNKYNKYNKHHIYEIEYKKSKYSPIGWLIENIIYTINNNEISENILQIFNNINKKLYKEKEKFLENNIYYKI